MVVFRNCKTRCEDKCGKCGSCFTHTPACWFLYLICPSTVPSLYIKNSEVTRILGLNEFSETNVDCIIALAAQLKETQKNKQWSNTREFCQWFQACFWFILIAIFGTLMFAAIERSQWDDYIAENEVKKALIESSLPIMDRVGEIVTALESAGGYDDLVSNIQTVYSNYSTNSLWSEVEVFAKEPSLLQNPWDVSGGLYFCMSIATTIGYGNFTPMTDTGKALVIPYSIFSILALLWFMKRNIRVFRHYWCADTNDVVKRTVMAVFMLIVYLALTGVVYMSLEEDWDYLDSIYFSWVTTSTIGFGDYYPDHRSPSMAGEFVMLFVALQFFTFLVDTVGYLMYWVDLDESTYNLEDVSEDLLECRKERTETNVAVELGAKKKTDRGYHNTI